MQSETFFTAVAPPVFEGENYHVWAIRMAAFLEANDLWEAVEEDYDVQPLPDNPTMAQLRYHKERKQRKSKAKACLFSAVSSSIFTRIMTLQSAKQIWDFLKLEYEGNEKVKGMQVLNLVREFEMQRMKESETVKEYYDRLLTIVNKVRLLGAEFKDSRVVQKILVTIPERFESTIASLENTKDLTCLTLAELVSALQAQEQRRLMRLEGAVEGAMFVKAQATRGKKEKGGNGSNEQAENKVVEDETRQGYPPCQHCGKENHPAFKCWKRPDIKCNKCHQFGHIARFCRNMRQQQQQQQQQLAQVTDCLQEEQLFTASCLVTSTTGDSWLIDSACSNHMTNNPELFKVICPVETTRVKIGNGEFMEVKGEGTVTIETCLGTKTISNVLYVPDVSQNLLSIGQLLEKGYRFLFEHRCCVITDANGVELFKVQMRGKCFSLDLLQDEQLVYMTINSSTELWHKRYGHYNHSDDSISGKKVKFMCSFGGKILPRPSDGMLRYVGGQTRIIGVRKDVSFNELVQKLVDTCEQPMVIKYQLPDEDLDALVSVSCQDDLDNMMEEYEKFVERSADGSAKLRVFLFSSVELDTSAMGQFGDLHDSGQHYFDAVNGVMDGVGGCIARKESIASATSTQNFDLSGTEAVDGGGQGHGNVIGPPSSSILSSKGNSTTSQDAAPELVSFEANPLISAKIFAVSVMIPNVHTVSSQPEAERSIPVSMPHQLEYDLHQAGMSVLPTSSYFQAYVDPHQEVINRTEYVHLPPQMGYSNTQLLAAPDPVFSHNSPVVPPQFIPALNMTMMPPTSHVALRPTLVQPLGQPKQNWLECYLDESMLGTTVQLPVEPSFNGYHPQLGPAVLDGGYGWHQIPQPDGAFFNK